MTKNSLKRIGNGLEEQFEIMEVLEQEIGSLKNSDEVGSNQALKDRLVELEKLLKLLASKTYETSEEILANVA